jgi:DNA-binding transcriptional regulator/RsmH inhibitor MraZ
MALSIGPTSQSITDGRLSLKKPHLEFLGNPASVDISYGPGNSILIHNPQRRQDFLNKVLPPQGTPLTDAEDFVDRRVGSGGMEIPVDDQGRIRIDRVYLVRAALIEKGATAYLLPRTGDGWIEVWSEENFQASLDNREDQWREALGALAARLR